MTVFALLIIYDAVDKQTLILKACGVNSHSEPNRVVYTEEVNNLSQSVKKP